MCAYYFGKTFSICLNFGKKFFLENHGKERVTIVTKISYVIPCFNSQNTIVSVVKSIKGMMKKDLKKYSYEIILVNHY